MTMRMTIVHHAGPGERFAVNAFRVGDVVPFVVTCGSVRMPAVLIAARVAEDGRSAELAFEIDGALIMPMPTHDGGPRLAQHVVNARRDPRRQCDDTKPHDRHVLIIGAGPLSERMFTQCEGVRRDPQLGCTCSVVNVDGPLVSGMWRDARCPEHWDA